MHMDNQSETQAVICTIPRSGTNLMEYFMRYLGLFLLAELDDWDSSEEYIFNSVANNSNTHRQFFPKVGHGYCPGYKKLQNNPWVNKLNKLPESDAWFNVLGRYLDSNINFDLTANKKLKVVFVYRNIYDFLLSLFDHLKNHKNYNFCDSNLEIIASDTVPQFVKSYVSFREMKYEYPDNILCVNYQDIIRDRKKILWDVCQFCQILVDHDNFKLAFEKAYQYTDKNELKRLEKFMGRTLAGDQKFYDPQNSHIRSVDRQTERDKIPTNLFEKIKFILHDYDISEFDEL